MSVYLFSIKSFPILVILLFLPGIGGAISHTTHISRWDSVHAIDEAKIKFEPTPTAFTTMAPQTFVVQASDDGALDKPVTIQNLKDLQEFATVVQADKTFTLTPTGKTGKVGAIFVYDGRIRKLPLTFGKSLNDLSKSVQQMAVGAETDLDVKLDGTDVTSADFQADEDKAYDKDVSSPGKLSVKPNTLNPGDLYATFNGFRYLILAKTRIKVSDVLQKVVLVDQDQQGVKKDPFSTTGGTHEFRVSVPHKGKAKFEIHGVYASDPSNSKKLTWLPTPSATTNFINIDSETGNGGFVIEGCDRRWSGYP